MLMFLFFAKWAVVMALTMWCWKEEMEFRPSTKRLHFVRWAQLTATCSLTLSYGALYLFTGDLSKLWLVSYFNQAAFAFLLEITFVAVGTVVYSQLVKNKGSRSEGVRQQAVGVTQSVYLIVYLAAVGYVLV